MPYSFLSELVTKPIPEYLNTISFPSFEFLISQQQKLTVKIINRIKKAQSKVNSGLFCIN